MKISRQILGGLCASMVFISNTFAFTDTSNSKHETAINALFEEGIVEGYEDGTFAPDQAVNRAEFVKILVEARYPGEAEGSSCFSDVGTQWYAKYICTAKELDIVEGYSDNSFRPGNTINLAEALKIVLETYQIEVCEDCTSIWYEPYYEKAKDSNWLEEISQNPAHEMTRGESAQLIYNVIDSCQEQLFGFWGLNGSYGESSSETANNLEDLAETTGMNAFIVATSPSYALNNQLPAVEAIGLTANFRMSGGNAELVDDEGDFDVEKWKDLVDEWTSSEIESQLEPYFGSSFGWHMLLDDIDTFDNDFGGENPTAEELATLAEYSKSLFPDLKTFIRQDAEDLPDGEYPYLDATLNQYSAKKGPLEEYIQSNLESASQLGIESIWGLNIVDGGDGSSGQHGTSTSKYLMSPEEIESYGETLLNTEGSLGLFLWEYDAQASLADGSTSADHFSSSAYQAVFLHLAELASCTNY